MLPTEFGFAQNLMTKLATAFHDCPKHLVIAATGEEDFASVKLEQSASDRPYIDAKVIRHPEDCTTSAMGDTSRSW